MEQTAQVSRLQHARMIGLLSVLWLADIGLLVFAVDSILLEGPTVMIMFASEVRFVSSLSLTLVGRAHDTNETVHDPPRQRLECDCQVHPQYDRSSE
jgi:hypothetical protein